MNWRLGLHRVSAVFWGFWGVVAALGVAFGASRGGTTEIAVISAVGVVFCYAAHRLCCWIVDGFIRP